ncbi:DUF5996 family protein [Phyllobacterium sp. CCNWLW109]|uniref:DUF5996 family protein n=1 Tax=Phyllobacterium sp. CCNWLW109 TaxID=3127479 RepID=UPI0030776AAC
MTTPRLPQLARDVFRTASLFAGRRQIPLAHTPWLNHSWNATFYVSPSGLASSPIPDGPGIEIISGFHEHAVIGSNGDGLRSSFALSTSTVADFHANFARLIAELDGRPDFHGQPNEVADPCPLMRTIGNARRIARLLGILIRL